MTTFYIPNKVSVCTATNLIVSWFVPPPPGPPDLRLVQQGNAWDVGTFQVLSWLSCTAAGEHVWNASTLPGLWKIKQRWKRKFQYPLNINVLRGDQCSRQKWNVDGLRGCNAFCFRANILYILKYIGVRL